MKTRNALRQDADARAVNSATECVCLRARINFELVGALKKILISQP